MRPYAVLAALFALPALVPAQTIVSTARFGYSGTVTRYNTLADAQSGANATAVGTIVQRDLGIGFFNNIPAYTANSNYIGTSWNYVSASAGGTPSNVNAGFIQIGDFDASTITSASASWNAGLDTFSFSLDGANALASIPGVAVNDYARLWNAPATTGSSGDTAGNFLSYHLDFTASGLAATWSASDNTFMSQTDPTAVTGNFNGLFENTSSVGTGFYTFDLALSLDSWVYDHRTDLTGTDQYASSVLATPTVIPEPATTPALIGLATAGFALWLKRRPRH
jgi:hypothetical protein